MIYNLVVTFVAIVTAGGTLPGVSGKLSGGVSVSSVSVGVYSSLENCQHAASVLTNQKKGSTFYGYASACIPVEPPATVTSATNPPRTNNIPAYQTPTDFRNAVGEIAGQIKTGNTMQLPDMSK
jgi:hypothetical protein